MLKKIINATTRRILITAIERIEKLESKIKESNRISDKLHQTNVFYMKKLYEIYSFIGLSAPLNNHADSYIS